MADNQQQTATTNTPKPATASAASAAPATVLSQVPDAAKVAPAAPTATTNTPKPATASAAPAATPAAPTGAVAAGAKPVDAKPVEPAPVAPVEIKIPEGFQADATGLDSFKKLAAEVGLKSEGAQKIFDLYHQAQKASEDAQKAQEAKWREEASKIPAPELGLAKKALVQLTAKMDPALRDEVRTILETTWMGNHPGILRLLSQAGALLAEDKIVDGGTARREFTAKDFFDNTK